MPRNSIPGIGVVNLDLAVTKKTSVFRELASLELRFEMFNSLNHTEFGSTMPGQNASAVNVSRTSTLFGPGYFRGWQLSGTGCCAPAVLNRSSDER
jgi:hypothetical protein